MNNSSVGSNRWPLSELDHNDLGHDTTITQHDQRGYRPLEDDGSIDPDGPTKRIRVHSYDSDKENTIVDTASSRIGAADTTKSVCTQDSSMFIFTPPQVQHDIDRCCDIEYAPEDISTSNDPHPDIVGVSSPGEEDHSQQMVGWQLIGGSWTRVYSTNVNDASISTNVTSPGAGSVDVQYEKFKTLQAQAVESYNRVQEAKKELEIAQSCYSKARRMIQLRDAEVELAIARFDDAKAKHREFRRRLFLSLSPGI